MKLTLMMVITADGIVARSASHNADWSSVEDKKRFVRETKRIGTLIMGSTTYRAIGRHLPKRLNVILTSDPSKYADKTIEGELEFMSGSPEEILKRLEDRGIQEAVVAGGPSTNQQFLKAGLVDEVQLTIEPKLFGGGMTFAMGGELDVDLELQAVEKLNTNTLWVKYRVIH